MEPDLLWRLEQRHIANVDKVMSLLEEVEARKVTPHTMMASVEGM